jgi:hypothetical protein
MILSDDVNDDDSIDDRTECNADYVEPREGDSGNAEDTTSDDNCCTEMDATDSYFHRKEEDEEGQGKKFHTHSMQMTKYSEKVTWCY